jgi:predicted Zn-dependent peptidase
LYDFTKYNVTVPNNALELMLWAEADRMRNLRFDSARFEVVRSVVKNEVRQQAFDRPYGRFVGSTCGKPRFSGGRIRTASTAIRRTAR